MKNIPEKIYMDEDDAGLPYYTVSSQREDEFQIEYILATPALKAAHDERQRQIEKEGYDENHDDEHVRGELSQAASVYALPPVCRTLIFNEAPNWWPWDSKFYKPTPDDRKREITKAMALLIAEYERLERKEETK